MFKKYEANKSDVSKISETLDDILLGQGMQIMKDLMTDLMS